MDPVHGEPRSLLVDLLVDPHVGQHLFGYDVGQWAANGRPLKKSNIVGRVFEITTRQVSPVAVVFIGKWLYTKIGGM